MFNFQQSNQNQADCDLKSFIKEVVLSDFVKKEKGGLQYTEEKPLGFCYGCRKQSDVFLGGGFCHFYGVDLKQKWLEKTLEFEQLQQFGCERIKPQTKVWLLKEENGILEIL